MNDESTEPIAQAAQAPADTAGRGTLRIAVAGGGTGGHLFPALAVLGALRKKVGQLEVVWLATTRPIDSRVLAQNRIYFMAQPVRPFTLRPWGWPGFWIGWRRSVGLAAQTLRHLRADVVLATGGYAAGPALRAARRLQVPAGMLNPDAAPGLANRTMGRYAARAFVQWDVTSRHFRPDQAIVTGCPVREEFLTAQKNSGCATFRLPADRPVLLLNGGSQGSRNVNLAMLDLAGWLRSHFADWQVLHVTGKADFEQVSHAYAGLAGYKAVAFTDQMPAALAAADLVISRAGASTLAEITAVGRASILLPYPYDRHKHQNDNAAVLAGAGAAVVVEDRCEVTANAAVLQAALQEIMSDEAKRQAMAEAAKVLGKPNAAERVADALLALAKTHPTLWL